ncbi:MAG: TerC family protein [Halofilum sp. (in: g-proteobacteria)]|nr:TerC family protein [Halofilum sp. (in: g-proteobacteria)]
MLELLTDPAAWASLLTLTALEIVLGIDNIVFLSIVSGRLPEHQQATARRLGLIMALLGRLLLLAGVAWIIGLTAPLFEAFGFVFSWRDAILLVGGLFLLYKGTSEMHEMVDPEDEGRGGRASATFTVVVVQIFLLDLVFSVDSVLTAIGMTEHIPIMVVAMVIAIGVMLLAAEPVADFVMRHPTVKALALAFLLLIGVTLVAEALHFHIPRGYLYFAIAFSGGVEAFNLWVMRRRKQRRAAAA